MYRYKFVLSIALGAALVLGLLLLMDASSISAEAQPLPALLALPALDHSDAISDALGYIRAQQQPDGGIDSFGFGSSNEGGTALAVLALVADGRPANWMTHTTTGRTVLDYLAAHAISYTHQTTYTTSDYLFPQQAGYLLVAVAAANEDPTNFGGMDLIAQLNDTFHPATGAYSTTAREGFYTGQAEDDNQAMVILGLSGAGQAAPVTATEYLLNSQDITGTWGSGDPDTTAKVVLALIASGNVQPTDTAIQNALDYFRDTQLTSGGWRPWWDTDPANADTTGWVIQALVAAGYTPATASWAKPLNPHEALLNLQESDGSIGGTYANAYSTIEAIFGLTEQPLFFLGQTHRANRALTWANEQQNSDGSWSGWAGPDPGITCDAVLAYAAAGFDPATVAASGSVTSAMDYLSATASSFVTVSADSAGKLALAVEAAGGDAYSFGGENIVHVLTNTWYSPTLGAFGVPTNTWHQAWAILGLAAAGENVPISAAQTLTGLQQSDGGWKYDLSPAWWNTTGPDNTGLALQALIAAGVPATDTSVVSGVLFLQNQQNDQGSWSSWGSPNANSTAYAVQGLLAAGEDLSSVKWLQDGHSPYGALTAFQKLDGPFALAGDDNTLATLQSVPALLEVHNPFTQTLAPFVAVNRGPDPDRMVACAPRASWGNSVDVVIPFGSDLDGDGDVALAWRASGASSWTTGTTVYRANGYFTATLPVTTPMAYEFRATFADTDDVQHGSAMTDTVVSGSTLEPHTVYLPLVLRQ